MMAAVGPGRVETQEIEISDVFCRFWPRHPVMGRQGKHLFPTLKMHSLKRISLPMAA
jgi:hypothetical protein